MATNDAWTFPENKLKKIPPMSYLHILNTNTNLVSLAVGPLTYMCKDEETVVFGPSKMIVIPPRHYVIVQNPVMKRKDEKGEHICYDRFGQAMLRHGDSEVRLTQEPFPLYPGELTSGRAEPLQVLEPNMALRMYAHRDFHDRYVTDKDGAPVFRRAGQEWLIHGPGTFIPQVEQRVMGEVRQTVLKPGEALKLRARKDFVDKTGKKRLAGSEWLLNQVGGFIPEVEEDIVEVVTPYILTDKIALRMKAQHAFVDQFGISRKPGEEWLVTRKDTELYIPHVYSTLVGEEKVVTLGKRQWCVKMNGYKNGRAQYGHEEIIRGELVFFLLPGEKIGPIQDVIVLTAQEGLKVQAVEDYDDNSLGKRIRRTAGESWIIPGPREFWPPMEIAVVGKINAILTVGNYNFFGLK